MTNRYNFPFCSYPFKNNHFLLNFQHFNFTKNNKIYGNSFHLSMCMLPYFSLTYTSKFKLHIYYINLTKISNLRIYRTLNYCYFLPFLRYQMPPIQGCIPKFDPLCLYKLYFGHFIRYFSYFVCYFGHLIHCFSYFICYFGYLVRFSYFIGYFGYLKHYFGYLICYF